MKLSITLFKESVAFAVKALRVNLLRTVLSLLGVTVGIFCIVGVSAFFDNIEGEIAQSFSMIGDDLIFVQKWPMGPEDGDEEYAWWKYMRRRNPTVRDADMLSERLTTAAAVSYQVKIWRTLENGNSNIENVPIAGVGFSHNKTVAIKLQSGRWFTETECNTGRPVCIIGTNVAQGLFGEQSPIGQKLKLSGVKMEVIGLIEREGNGLMPESLDDIAIINIGSARRLVDLRNAQEVSITVKAAEGISVDETKDELIGTLRAIRGVKPKQANDFSVIEASFILDAMQSVFGVLDITSIVIGIFALLVGGFGVLNIMYVSVRERTGIIGIQKSLGANNRFIRNQFLMEAIFLCLIGAAVALLLVWVILLIVSGVMEMTLTLSLGNVLYGVSIATGIGLLAGFLPARKASRMNPVEAIRFK